MKSKFCGSSDFKDERTSQMIRLYASYMVHKTYVIHKSDITCMSMSMMCMLGERATTILRMRPLLSLIRINKNRFTNTHITHTRCMHNCTNAFGLFVSIAKVDFQFPFETRQPQQQQQQWNSYNLCRTIAPVYFRHLALSNCRPITFVLSGVFFWWKSLIFVLPVVGVVDVVGWLRLVFVLCLVDCSSNSNSNSSTNTGVDFIIIILRRNKCYFIHFISNNSGANGEWDNSMAIIQLNVQNNNNGRRQT